MMSDVSTRYAAIAAGFSRRLEGVPPDGCDSQSPCEDWKARDVAEQVIATHRRVLSLVDGDEVGAPASDDLVGAWREDSGRIQTALAHPAKADRMLGGRMGAMALDQLVGTLLYAGSSTLRI